MTCLPIRTGSALLARRDVAYARVMGKWLVVMTMALVATACGGDPEVQGVAGAPCFPNDTCNAGLACESGTCVEETVGSAGAACYPNDTCDTGLVCVNDRCRAPACGDGITDPAEACDDGNTAAGDGCSASCLFENCGDGVVSGGEACDDAGESATCNLDCTTRTCGDGKVNATAGEQCDALTSNADNRDCRADCQLNTCGDGAPNTLGPAHIEACDDGNDVNTDGCSTACTTPFCGNGIKDPAEACDDGNTAAGDGCSASCLFESCGDGVVSGGEACDDGNDVNSDGCSTACTTPFCGNGIVDMGEQCDDGNGNNLDGCQTSCLYTPSPGSKICLNGTTGRGRSVAVNPFALLTAATIEFWYRSSDPSTPATAQVNLVHFHPLAYVGGDYPGLVIEIGDAGALSMSSLTGRTLGVVIDARGGPQGQLNARGFDLDATFPGFDEKGWHHYAIVFTGSLQRAWVDGVELTTTMQRDSSQATTFASAFGANFTSVFGSLYLSLGYFARDSIRYVRGGMSDLRVSNTARYSSTFTPPFRATADASTLLLLPMNEGVGTTSFDRSGNAYDVTWSGGTSWSGLLLPCP